MAHPEDLKHGGGAPTGAPTPHADELEAIRELAEEAGDMPTPNAVHKLSEALVRLIDHLSPHHESHEGAVKGDKPGAKPK